MNYLNSQPPQILDTIPSKENGDQQDQNAQQYQQKQNDFMAQNNFPQPYSNQQDGKSSMLPGYQNFQYNSGPQFQIPLGMNQQQQMPMPLNNMPQPGMQFGPPPGMNSTGIVMHPNNMLQPGIGLGMSMSPGIFAMPSSNMAMPPSGMPPSGMPPSGMPPSGMPPSGMTQNPIPPGMTQHAQNMQNMSYGMPSFPNQQRFSQISYPNSSQIKIQTINDNENYKKNQEINQKEDEIQKLKLMHNQILEEKEQQIENLKSQIQKLQKDKTTIANELKLQNEEINSDKMREQEFKKKLDQQRETIQNQEKQIQELQKQYQTEIKKLQNEMDYQKNENKIQIQNLTQTNQTQFYQLQESTQLKEKNKNLEKIINEQRLEIEKREKEIQTKNRQIDGLNQINQQQNSHEQVVTNLQKQLAQQNQNQQTLIQENKHLQAQNFQLTNEYKNILTQNEILENDNKIFKERALHFETECSALIQKLEEQNQNRTQNDPRNDIPTFLREIQQRQESVKKQQEDQRQLQRERIIQKQMEETEKQKQLNHMGKQKMIELIRKAGQIQCCFVLDLYKSNEKTGKSIIKATETCCRQIKATTNRESFWGAVCYAYEKSSLKMNKQDFTDSADILSGFLKSQKLFKDEKDQPEDLKAALQNMLKLNWTEKYKLAIVIPNSPCHGKKYHHPKKYKSWFFFSRDYDTKPNDDMEDIIREIVKKDIILLLIRFNDETKVMCSELEKIYSKLKFPQLFHTLSVKGLDQENSSHELVQQIQKMAAFIIGTDNKMTKTKINQQARMLNFEEGLNDMKNLKQEVVHINQDIQKEISNQGGQKQGEAPIVSIQDAIEDKKHYEEAVQRVKECTDGALQALCKRGEISDFDKRVKCENFNCKVYTVELKQSSFEKKLERIEDIKYQSEDFELKFQNDWDCIRTQSPFAFGMMKAVYLMKKKNNSQEIYVVKIPIEKGTYQSKADAVNDCRSHLIAKSLMKEFIDKIREKDPKIKQVQYTDFLLLEENQNKYWIAERFFKGNFEKYNNNDGYISEENSELNAISQAFSYFTYQRSQYNYIVNDIQGVDIYFTDPAINTVKGNFDETDVGEDGISSYLSTLQMRKIICQKLLSSLDIEID